MTTILMVTQDPPPFHPFYFKT